MQSGALFPLTLALSLRERERLSTAWEYPLNGEHYPALPMVLLLPEGEGRGEGEGRFLLNAYGLVCSTRREEHQIIRKQRNGQSLLTGVLPKSLASLKVARVAGSLSSFGGEGQGEEAVVLRHHAR
jgi:hypothetical protein